MTICASCTTGPSGEGGHLDLSHYIEGPYPGHHIYKCGACDERWIRHYGGAEERFAWKRYDRQFVTGPRKLNVRPAV